MSRIENLVFSALIFLMAACTQMKSNALSSTEGSRSLPPSPVPAPPSTPGTPGGTTTPVLGATLAEQYPRDVGIASDSSVVWSEHFNAGSLTAVLSRYDNYVNVGGMALVQDAPSNSSSPTSIRLTSSPANPATDFYKNFANDGPGHDELYFRWYVKYQPGVEWHHSGVWFGGYYPALDYPSPHAGELPQGNDRFSISVEPVHGFGPTKKFDFYNYWMNEHHNASTTTYWGNPIINQDSFTVNEGSWNCIEVRLKLNSDMNSASGGMLELWKNNVLVQSFNPTGPAGYWVHDKYCTTGNTTAQCAYSPTAQGPVNLQMRTTQNLNINYFWPQNYITSGSAGSLWFSNMVVATRRVGCLAP